MAEAKKEENKLKPLYVLQDAIRHLPSTVNGVSLTENVRMLLILLGQHIDARTASCFVREDALREEMAIAQRRTFDDVVSRLKRTCLVTTRQQYTETGNYSCSVWKLDREKIMQFAKERQDDASLDAVIDAALRDGETYMSVLTSRKEQVRGRIFGRIKRRELSAHIYVTEAVKGDVMTQLRLSTTEQVAGAEPEPEPEEQPASDAADFDDVFFWQERSVERGVEDAGVEKMLAAARRGETVKLPRELPMATRSAIVRRAQELAGNDGTRVQANDEVTRLSAINGLRRTA